jgi:hypothetical protein
VDNHERVRDVNKLLKELGFVTWFDDEKLTGNIVDQMTGGIDASAFVLVFVTRRYIDKVGGENQLDNCKREFNYASTRKGADRMIAVVMEEECRNQKEWGGSVGFTLGNHLYIDCSVAAELGSQVRKISDELRTRLKKFYPPEERVQSLAAPDHRSLLSTKQAAKKAGETNFVAKTGDSVVIVKVGANEGRIAEVVEPDWNGMMKVAIDGTIKSYKHAHLERVSGPGDNAPSTILNEKLLWQDQAKRMKERLAQLQLDQSRTRVQLLLGKGTQEVCYHFAPTSVVTVEQLGRKKEKQYRFMISDMELQSEKQGEAEKKKKKKKKTDEAKLMVLAAKTEAKREEWLKAVQQAIAFEMDLLVQRMEDSTAGGASIKWLQIDEKQRRPRLMQHLGGQQSELLLNSLHRHYNRSACNLLSIFGKARQGKSFLMNMLADCEGLFEISNKAKPCTNGVDLSAHTTALADFGTPAHSAAAKAGGGSLDLQRLHSIFGRIDANADGSVNSLALRKEPELCGVLGLDKVYFDELLQRMGNEIDKTWSWAECEAQCRSRMSGQGSDEEESGSNSAAAAGAAAMSAAVVPRRIGSSSADHPSLVRIGFVDAEGMGDRDISYDMLLFTPVLLVSKCCVFNWKGGLEKDAMLDLLGTLAKNAKRIELRDEGGGEEVEEVEVEEVEEREVEERQRVDAGQSAGGNGAAQDAQQDAQQDAGGAVFGHLHIVFRDWQFQTGSETADGDTSADDDSSDDEDDDGTAGCDAGTKAAVRKEAVRKAQLQVWNDLFGIETGGALAPDAALRKQSSSLSVSSETNSTSISDGATADATAAAKPVALAPDAANRNRIRALLHGAFESIRVWLLPPPVDKVSGLKKKIKFELVNKGFVGQVREMQAIMAGQLQTPPPVFTGADMPLSFDTLGGMVASAVEGMNGDHMEKLRPVSMFQQMANAKSELAIKAFTGMWENAWEECERDVAGEPWAADRIKTHATATQDDLVELLGVEGEEALAKVGAIVKGKLAKLLRRHHAARQAVLTIQMMKQENKKLTSEREAFVKGLQQQLEQKEAELQQMKESQEQYEYTHMMESQERSSSMSMSAQEQEKRIKELMMELDAAKEADDRERMEKETVAAEKAVLQQELRSANDKLQQEMDEGLAAYQGELQAELDALSMSTADGGYRRGGERPRRVTQEGGRSSSGLVNKSRRSSEDALHPTMEELRREADERREQEDGMNQVRAELEEVKRQMARREVEQQRYRGESVESARHDGIGSVIGRDGTEMARTEESMQHENERLKRKLQELQAQRRRQKGDSDHGRSNKNGAEGAAAIQNSADGGADGGADGDDGDDGILDGTVLVVGGVPAAVPNGSFACCYTKIEGLLQDGRPCYQNQELGYFMYHHDDGFWYIGNELMSKGGAWQCFSEAFTPDRIRGEDANAVAGWGAQVWEVANGNSGWDPVPTVVAKVQTAAMRAEIRAEAERTRLKASEVGDVVFKGLEAAATQGNTFASLLLGKFELQKHMVNNRPTYKLPPADLFSAAANPAAGRQEGGQYLYSHADGFWYVGSEVGKPAGKMKVRSNALLPTEITDMWSVGLVGGNHAPKDKQWEPWFDVACVKWTASDQQAEKEAAERARKLAKESGTMVVQGVPEYHPIGVVMGLYKLTAQTSNGRPVYKFGETGMSEFIGLLHRDGHWYIRAQKMLDGEEEVSLARARDNAETPDMITAEWELRTGGSGWTEAWTSMPSLQVHQQTEEEVQRLREEERIALEQAKAAGDVKFVGYANGPNALRVAYPFKLTAQTHNARPVYKREQLVGGKTDHLYFAGRHWCINDIVGEVGGGFQAQDEAMVPSSVADGKWQVADRGPNGSQVWTDVNMKAMPWGGAERQQAEAEARPALERRKARARAIGDIVLEGQLRGEPNYNMMGRYTLTDETNNDRPVYRRRNLVLYHCVDGFWYVGGRLNESGGGAQCNDSCDTPADIRSVWQVADDRVTGQMEWVDVPLITTRAADPTRYPSQDHLEPQQQQQQQRPQPAPPLPPPPDMVENLVVRAAWVIHLIDSRLTFYLLVGHGIHS